MGNANGDRAVDIFCHTDTLDPSAVVPADQAAVLDDLLFQILVGDQRNGCGLQTAAFRKLCSGNYGVLTNQTQDQLAIGSLNIGCVASAVLRGERIMFRELAAIRRSSPFLELNQ